VTPEFTRSQNLGYGDKVRIAAATDPSRGHLFEIAGVVTSPALDIAANYFNASGMLASQSAYVVLGTQADLVRYLRVSDTVSMFLLNFELRETTPPPEFHQDQPPSTIWQPGPMAALVEAWAPLLPERSGEIATIRRQLALAQSPPPQRPESELNGARGASQGASETAPGNTSSPGRLTSPASADSAPGTQPSQSAEHSLRYADLPMLDLFKKAQELVLRLVPRRADARDEQHASVRALKIQIDRDLGRATMIFTTIPMVALIVAALGVGNLMMANVSNRTRQLAMLRAVGATKSQITRLIIGEAIVLGALGSMLGLALGPAPPSA
jgi:hypothetical protein